MIGMVWAHLKEIWRELRGKPDKKWPGGWEDEELFH